MNKKGHKWLTTFNNQYGQFKYLVIPFGLCNAPDIFQDYINKSLWKYLDVFCTAYLDNILIYSKKSGDYAGQMLQVLRRLHEQRLQVDIDKCKFLTKRVKYLGMIVTIKGIKMDLDKIKAVQNWEALTSIKEIQAFLGFANFYCQFIPNFSKLSQSLVSAIKRSHYITKSGNKKIKYDLFEWNNERQKAFEGLKQAFTTSPVLAHYDPALETWIETNASNYVIARVLS